MKKLLLDVTPPLARYFFLILLALIFLGCKVEKTVSLGEAKTITAEFVGKTFKAPPRSSEDLIELAKTHDRPPASDVMAHRRIEAQAEPSEEVKNDPAAYAVFLQDRAGARRLIGDFPGSVEDARLAYRIFTQEQPEIHDVGKFLRSIAWREFLGGNYDEALRIAEMAFKHASANRIHLHIRQLLRFAVWRGDIEEAKRYLNELEINRLGKARQSGVYLGRTMIAHAEGRWADTEREAKNWKDHLIYYYSGDWIPNSLSFIADYIAVSLTEQGRLQEAELVLRERLLEELKRFGSSRAANVAELYGDLAKVYLSAGRLEDALALARQSCVIARKLKMG